METASIVGLALAVGALALFAGPAHGRFDPGHLKEKVDRLRGRSSRPERFRWNRKAFFAALLGLAVLWYLDVSIWIVLGLLAGLSWFASRRTSSPAYGRFEPAQGQAESRAIPPIGPRPSFSGGFFRALGVFLIFSIGIWFLVVLTADRMNTPLDKTFARALRPSDWEEDVEDRALPNLLVPARPREVHRPLPDPPKPDVPVAPVPPTPPSPPRKPVEPTPPARPAKPAATESRTERVLAAAGDALARVISTSGSGERTSGRKEGKPVEPSPSGPAVVVPPEQSLEEALSQARIAIESSLAATAQEAEKEALERISRLLPRVLESKLAAVDAGDWTPSTDWIQRRVVKHREILPETDSDGDEHVRVRLEVHLAPEEVEAIHKRFESDRQASRTFQVARAYAGAVLVLGGLAIVSRLGTGRRRPPNEAGTAVVP